MNTLFTFAAAFCYGAYSLSSQILLVRELLSLSNANEVIICIVLGLFMLFGAVGNVISIHMLKNNGEGGKPVLYAVCTILYSIIFPVVVVSLSFVKYLFGLYEYDVLSLGNILQILPFTIVPIAFLNGMIFPAILRMDSENSPFIYIIEALGAAVGAVIIILFISPTMHPYKLAFVISMVAIMPFLIGCSISLPNGKRKKISLIAIIILAASLLYPVVTDNAVNMLFEPASI